MCSRNRKISDRFYVRRMYVTSKTRFMDFFATAVARQPSHISKFRKHFFPTVLQDLSDAKIRFEKFPRLRFFPHMPKIRHFYVRTFGPKLRLRKPEKYASDGPISTSLTFSESASTPLFGAPSSLSWDLRKCAECAIYERGVKTRQASVMG